MIMLYIQYDNVSAIAQKVSESNHYHTQLRLNLTRVRNRCVRSRDVHPCCMVSRCPVSRCPPLLSGAVFVRSRDVRSRDFSVPLLSYSY